MSEIKRTLEWFKQAMPEPTIEQACIQVGCHLEEVEEMMVEVNLGGSPAQLEILNESNGFKDASCYYKHKVEDVNKADLLDSLVDQIVTAIGVCHTMGFDLEGALAEVNRSNFSKFEDGQAVFDENGKITKGKHYSKPDLKPYI